MTVIDIPLEDICDQSLDPFGRDSIAHEVSLLKMELMTEKVFFHLMGRRDLEVSLINRRPLKEYEPIEEIPASVLKKYYLAITSARDVVKKQTEEKKYKSAWRVSYDELCRILRVLENIVSKKEVYVKTSESDEGVKPDFGYVEEFTYCGKKEDTHHYSTSWGDHEFRVTVTPMKQRNLYSIQSEVRMSRVHMPHTKHERIVDLSRTSIMRELKREYTILKYDAEHVNDRFVR